MPDVTAVIIFQVAGRASVKVCLIWSYQAAIRVDANGYGWWADIIGYGAGSYDRWSISHDYEGSAVFGLSLEAADRKTGLRQHGR